MDESNQYLTEIEVSRITRFSTQTLRNHRFKRRGMPYHKVGRSVRYKLADVIRFMEAGRIETPCISEKFEAAKGGVTLEPEANRNVAMA